MLVCIFGIYGIFSGLKDWTDSVFITTDLIGIIAWAIFANILYSTGIIVEILDEYYLNGKLKLHRFRMLFLIFGTLFSCFVTWFNAWKYYAHFELW